MYAIGVLGAMMVLESFGQEYPFWLAPLNMIILLAIFLFLSVKANKELKGNAKLAAISKS